MSNTPTVLVVDDDFGLREMLDEYLTKQGLQVVTAEGGARARQLMAERPVDLAVLDIHMPGEDGLSLARFLRDHYPTGIVILTAAGEVVDRIVGLELGADDYLPKPFNLRELLARIKAILRRMTIGGCARATPSADPPKQVRFGHCVLNLDAQKLFLLNGQEIRITSMEFDLLHTFATHPNRVLTRDQLLEMAHHRAWDVFDRSIDIRISRLRRKIEPEPSTPQTIKTVRGSGYMYVMPAVA